MCGNLFLTVRLAVGTFSTSPPFFFIGWEQVVEKIKTAPPSTFWAIPTKYPLSDKQLRQASLRLPQIMNDKPGSVERLGNNVCNQKGGHYPGHGHAPVVIRGNFGEAGWRGTNRKQ
jgi:hypothetical protein